jgi:HK97 gp10 family phage protein
MIRVRLEGLDKAIRNLESWETEKIQAVANQFSRSALAVEREAKIRVPTNYGKLKTSIQHNITKTDSGRVISADVEADTEYAAFVEFGTKANVQVPLELAEYARTFYASGTGTFDQLLENIKEWARKKGIPQEAAYPIARKIAREGVRAQPFLFPAFDRERPILIQKLRGILNEK